MPISLLANILIFYFPAAWTKVPSVLWLWSADMKRIPTVEALLTTGVTVAGAMYGGRLRSKNWKDIHEVSISVVELYTNWHHRDNSSWEAASCVDTQELPKILWNPKVHYRVHESTPLVPILSWINRIPTLSISVRSISILSTHLRLGLPSDYFLLAFPPISYMHSYSSSFGLHALLI
jgi:hypothetical protein